MKVTRAVWSMVVAGSILWGCTSTDLNRPCQLVKRNPDGGSPLLVLEHDVIAKINANNDIISLGSVECEDLVCVRDSAYKTDAGADAPAMGYCSSGCVQGGACASYDSSMDKGPNALRCRALLLDQETLKALADQGLNPGNVRDPYFCARGSSGDGGT